MKIFIERIKEFLYDKKIKILGYSVVIIVIVSFCLISNLIYESNKVEEPIIEKEEEVIEKEVAINLNEVKEVKSKYIYIDVKGSVENPGVYEIEENKRVIDVIDKAGGLSKNANTRFINLAKELSDGDVIVIYSNEEIEKKEKEKIVYVDVPCVCEEVKNDACYKEESVGEQKEETKALISINSSTFEELTTLSGIGEAKAKAIIAYREITPFVTIEDIKNVSGISESLYSKIKDFITI